MQVYTNNELTSSSSWSFHGEGTFKAVNASSSQWQTIVYIMG